MTFALGRRWRQLYLWLHRGRLSRELDEELEHHFLLAQGVRIENGLTAEAATIETRRALGNVTLAKEESRDAWGFPAIDRVMQDIRYSLRILRRNPGFSTVAIVSLALGIAGTTAIFSIVNALMLRPLPFRDSDRLVRITELYPKAIFNLFQRHCRTLDIASISPGFEFNLTSEGPAVRITGSETSVNFFEVIGTRVERGRSFEADEDRPGIDRVVILSHELWTTTFHHDADILGRSIQVGGVNRRVIGIMPAGFSLPSSKVQVWIPARMDPSNMTDYWGGEFVPLIARLRPGATIAEARNEIHALASGVWKLFPFPMPKHWNADSTVISLQADLLGHTRGTLFILLGAVCAVLVIACANVAGLLLARATTRRKEIAMRAALGAGAMRIVRQLLTESIVLSFLATSIGVLLGVAAVSLFRPVIPADLSGLTQGVTVDWRVMGFAGALSILTGLSFGIVPALSAARLNLVEALKSGTQRSATRTWIAMRSWLIAGEIALTLVLVLGGGLLVKSLYALTAVNPGFNAHRVLTMQISPSESFCANRMRCIAFYNRILEQVRGVSGVMDAAVVNTVPLDGMLPSIPVDVEDHPKTADFPAPMLWTGAITPNYLRLMEIPLLSGRAFTIADTANAAPVILITASTAKRFWPGVSPIGKHIKPVSENQWRTIVGVVADVKQFDLEKHSPSSISGAIYMPYAQSIQSDGQIPAVMNLLVKTTGGAEQAGSEIRRIVADANPDIPAGKVIALQQIVGGSISGVRSTILIFLSFAAAALILAAVGIYGLMSYSVSQRTYEIGLRIAVGASNGSIVGLILAQSVRVTLIGIAAGLATSFLLTRLLSSLLFGVSSTDPTVLVGVCLFLTMVSVAATSIPAWRAARIDPIRILRAE